MLSKYKVPFCDIHIPNWDKVREYLKLSEQEQISNFGPCYRLLTQRLTEYLNIDTSRKEVILTSSGHTAIMAALFATNSKNILLPNYTFSSTFQAARLCNITSQARTIYIVDTNKQGFLDWEILKQNIDRDFDTVLAVCPISQIPDLESLQRWCLYTGKNLIIDGAATFGTEGIFNYGNAYCLSFHATKSFPVGECGAVIIDKDKSDLVKQYINFGLDKNRDIQSIGLNAKVSDYTCAIGLALLDEIEEPLDKRRRNTLLFDKALIDNTYLQLPGYAMGDIFQTYPIWVNRHSDKNKNNKCADKLRIALLKAGYEIKQYYKPINLNIDSDGHSRRLYETNICLPCHPGVTEKDIEDICKIINRNI